MYDELITRLMVLECHLGDVGSIARDFRVIEMQIARAEEKILRMARSSAWTNTKLPVRLTEDE